jgi:hypothetical protein
MVTSAAAVSHRGMVSLITLLVVGVVFALADLHTNKGRAIAISSRP